MKNRLYVTSVALLVVIVYQAGVHNNFSKSDEKEMLSQQNQSEIQLALEEHLDEKTNGLLIAKQIEKDIKIEQLENKVAVLEKELNGKKKNLIEYKAKVLDYERKAQTVFTDIPQTNFKAFMGYKKITNRSSNQWKLQQQPEAWTDEKGYRRFGDDYMIAVGQAFGKSGDRLRVTMSDGKIFLATIGDSKKIVDTDESNMQCVHNGSILEFIVDEPKFRENKEQFIEFQGSAVKIERLGKNEMAKLE